MVIAISCIIFSVCVGILVAIVYKRKQVASVPTKKKKEPRSWRIPKEHLEEVLGLYDDMMARGQILNTPFGTAISTKRELPRYLFWKKIFEVIPELSNLTIGLDVKKVGFIHCIEIIEDISDDKADVFDDDDDDGGDEEGCASQEESLDDVLKK
jgi:hypothetical protein